MTPLLSLLFRFVRQTLRRTRPERPILPLSLALSVCAACTTVGPEYTAPDLAPRVSSHFRAEALYSGELTPQASLDNWWEQFEDPTLNYLVDAALSRNQTIEVALYGVQAAWQTEYATHRNRFPTLGASANTSRSRTAAAAIVTDVPTLGEGLEAFEGSNEFNLATTASWEVDLVGRLARTREAATAEAGQAYANFLDVQRVVVGETVSAYAAYLGTELRLAITDKNIALVEQFSSTVDKLLASKAATVLDKSQAMASFQEVRSARYEILSERETALNRLAVLTGIPPAQFDRRFTEISPSLPFPKSLPITDPISVLRQRPDIRLAEREVALETARIGIAQADYYPRLQWASTFGLSSAQVQNLLTGPAFTYSLGPSLDFALLDYPQIGARVDAQTATMQAALARFDQAVLQALEETENALAAYWYETHTLQSLSAAVAARQAAKQQTDLRVSAGIGSLLDRLEADRDLIEAQRLLAESEVRAFTRLIEVYRAFGGSVSDDKNLGYQAMILADY